MPCGPSLHSWLLCAVALHTRGELRRNRIHVHGINLMITRLNHRAFAPHAPYRTHHRPSRRPRASNAAWHALLASFKMASARLHATLAWKAIGARRTRRLRAQRIHTSRCRTLTCRPTAFDAPSAPPRDHSMPARALRIALAPRASTLRLRIIHRAEKGASPAVVHAQWASVAMLPPSRSRPSRSIGATTV